MGALSNCCNIGIVLIAAFLGLVTFYGRRNDRMMGSLPAFVNENIIDPTKFPDMTGKVVIITGANTGLGRSSAKQIANQGATVIMGCRSLIRCKDAKIIISEEIKKGNLFSDSNISTALFKPSRLIPMKLDLGDFDSIRSFAVNFKESYSRLDSLLLNAGIAHAPFHLTKSLIEAHMGVNHVRFIFCFNFTFSLVIFY